MAGAILVLLLRSFGAAAAVPDPMQQAMELMQQAEAQAAQRRYGDAEELEARAIAIFDHAFGADHLFGGMAEARLAGFYRLERRYTDAEAMFRRAIGALARADDPLRQSVDPNSLALADAEHELASMYAEQGTRLTEAATLFERAADSYEQAQAWERLAQTDTELGDLFRQTQQYAEAERFSGKGREAAERSGNNLLLARSLNGWATVEQEQVRFDDAEAHYKQALALLDQALGPNSAESGTVLGNMGMLNMARGRNADAARLLQRALTMPGRSKRDIARDVTNLAILYFEMGENDKAAALGERAVTLNEEIFGPDHPAVATAEHNLAGIYSAEHRSQEAEHLERHALAIRERAFGSNSPIVATSLNALAAELKDEGRDTDAIPLYERAIAIDTEAFGGDRETLATAIRNLGILYLDQGHADQAASLLSRALEMRRRLYGPDHPSVGRSLIELAGAKLGEGDLGRAREETEQGMDTLQRWLAAPLAERTEAAVSEQRMYRSYFLRAVSLLTRIAERDDDAEREGDWDQAFIAGQLARTSATAQTLAAMAARFAMGSGELAAVARQRSDLVQRSAELQARIAQAFSQASEARNAAAEQGLVAEEAAIRQRLEGVEATIADRSPRFAELSHPRPLTRAEAQVLLGANEALVAITVDDGGSYI
ncbi:MAG: tetratricopeptide repeat protein [Acetobacteraceae bacterium]|nr:tetratricopeptide repeat protein [Acetobacteraceae bacterium]